MTRNKVECQVCHKMVRETIKCLCDKWLCAKCTVYDFTHSSCHDPYHIDLFWKLHPREKMEVDRMMGMYAEEPQK